jgi:hypothetical protein
MDNVQNYSNFVNIPSSQTFRCYLFPVIENKSDEDLRSRALDICIERRMMFSERIVRGTSLLLGTLWRSLAQIPCAQFTFKFGDTVIKLPIRGS